jgi:hypothetical protein
MIVKPVLPIVACPISVLLPVFADLIAVLLPFLSLLAPVARWLLTEPTLVAGEPILKRVTALFGRSVGNSVA